MSKAGEVFVHCVVWIGQLHLAMSSSLRIHLNCGQVAVDSMRKIFRRGRRVRRWQPSATGVEFGAGSIITGMVAYISMNDSLSYCAWYSSTLWKILFLHPLCVVPSQSVLFIYMFVQFFSLLLLLDQNENVGNKVTKMLIQLLSFLTTIQVAIHFLSTYLMTISNYKYSCENIPVQLEKC